MSRPRILIADDHPVVAQGLKSMLSAEFDVLNVVTDGRAMVDAARTLLPDVIVADVSMPELGGIDALEEMRQAGIDTPVVFLTMHNQPGYARRAFKAGAAGYVLKLSAPDELVQAIRAALAGDAFVSPALARAGIGTGPGVTDDGTDRVATLTPHQRTILRLFALGMSAKEIARKLDISPNTVKTHIASLFAKLEVQRRTQAIQKARELRILP